MNAPLKTGLTHAGTAIGGAVAAVSFLAQHQVDLYAAWNQLNAIVAEITKFIALITPVVTGAYGIYRSTTKNRLAEIANDPKAVEAAKEMPVTPSTVALSNALVKSIALVLAIGLMTMMFQPGDALAQGIIQRAAQRNDVNNKTAVSPLVSGIQDKMTSLADKFYSVSRDDLTVAIGYATAAEDKAALACYTEWQRQTDIIIKLRADFPDKDGPQLISAFQKVRNLVKLLDASSPFRQACAALAMDAKDDVNGLVTKLVTGVAIKTFFPLP